MIQDNVLYDTIILGAGAAGLAAGRVLHDAGQKIIILEARDRIGGRIWTDENFANFPVELGAEFIHGENASTHDLAKAAGIATIPAPRMANLWYSDGTAPAVPVACLPAETRNILDAVLAAERNLPAVCRNFPFNAQMRAAALAFQQRARFTTAIE